MYPALATTVATYTLIAARGALGRSWIGTIVIGLVIGFIAKFLTPGREPSGCIITMLIGIAGALLATFIGSHVGLYQEGQRAGFFMSLLGAIILLAIYRLIKGKTATT